MYVQEFILLMFSYCFGSTDLSLPHSPLSLQVLQLTFMVFVLFSYLPACKIFPLSQVLSVVLSIDISLKCLMSVSSVSNRLKQRCTPQKAIDLQSAFSAGRSAQLSTQVHATCSAVLCMFAGLYICTLVYEKK